MSATNLQLWGERERGKRGEGGTELTPANGYGNVRFVGFRVGYRQENEKGQWKGREGG